MNIINTFRRIIWRLLGFDYQIMLNKADFVLLKNDIFTIKGTGTYDNGAKVWRWTDAELVIGKYCSIAYDVNFIVDEGFHKGSSVSNYAFVNKINKEEFPAISINQKKGIVVGHDVWIGMGAFIMPGITIGNGVIIGSNSVITKDIPDFAIVAGSPGKILKFKFDQKTIDLLNSIAWWNWSAEKINKEIPYFYTDLNIFLNKNG